MKKILKYLILGIIVFAVTGCSSGGVKKISYSDLEKLLKNKETFILEVVQDGCHNCESFEPKFEKIVKEYGIEVKLLNLTSLSEKENTKLSGKFNVSGTPTIIFIEDGEEKTISKRIVGDVSKEKIITKLEVAGYIKK